MGPKRKEGPKPFFSELLPEQRDSFRYHFSFTVSVPPSIALVWLVATLM